METNPVHDALEFLLKIHTKSDDTSRAHQAGKHLEKVKKFFEDFAPHPIAHPTVTTVDAHGDAGLTTTISHPVSVSSPVSSPVSSSTPVPASSPSKVIPSGGSSAPAKG